MNELHHLNTQRKPLVESVINTACHLMFNLPLMDKLCAGISRQLLLLIDVCFYSIHMALQCRCTC